jgi:hypothetical protein
MLANRLFGALDGEVRLFPMLDYAEKTVYAKHIGLIHQIITASEGMLEEAAKIASPCQAYFAEHLEGERGHEKWLAKDIAQLGVDVMGMEFLAAALAGSQYYLIKHVTPLALLGYMAVLEGYPASEEQVAELEALYPDSVATLKYHAVHDREHRAELITQLDAVPDEFHDLIVWNAVQSARLYGHLLRGL